MVPLLPARVYATIGSAAFIARRRLPAPIRPVPGERIFPEFTVRTGGAYDGKRECCRAAAREGGNCKGHRIAIKTGTMKSGAGRSLHQQIQLLPQASRLVKASRASRWWCHQRSAGG